jgi:hypothetical protein
VGGDGIRLGLILQIQVFDEGGIRAEDVFKLFHGWLSHMDFGCPENRD